MDPLPAALSTVCVGGWEISMGKYGVKTPEKWLLGRSWNKRAANFQPSGYHGRNLLVNTQLRAIVTIFVWHGWQILMMFFRR